MTGRCDAAAACHGRRSFADHGGRGARAAGRLPSDVVRAGRPAGGHAGPGARTLASCPSAGRTCRAQGRRRCAPAAERPHPTACADADPAAFPASAAGRPGRARAARRRSRRLVVPRPGPRARRARASSATTWPPRRPEAEDLGWTVDDSTEDRRDGTEPGEVLAQDPTVGESLAEGEVAPPDRLAGPDADRAAEGRRPARRPRRPQRCPTPASSSATVTRAPDEAVPADAVIAAAPADAALAVDSQGRLPKESTIDLVVSGGPAPRVGARRTAGREGRPTPWPRSRRCSWWPSRTGPTARWFPRAT